jgi:hypothetical protein
VMGLCACTRSSLYMYYTQRKAYYQRDPRVHQSRANARGHPTTTTRKTTLARARESERKRRGRPKKT